MSDNTELINSRIKSLATRVDLNELAQEINHQWLIELFEDEISGCPNSLAKIRQIFLFESSEPIGPLADEITANDIEQWAQHGFRNPGLGHLYEHLEKAILAILNKQAEANELEGDGSALLDFSTYP